MVASRPSMHDSFGCGRELLTEGVGPDAAGDRGIDAAGAFIAARVRMERNCRPADAAYEP
jgi:hypothetical protein